MGWVALGRCAGGGGRLSSVLSLSLTSLASSLIFTILCILTLALTLVTLVRAEDIFEEGKSDKEILDNLLLSTRYDKRLLPPVQGTLTVNVSVLLLSLASPDESSLKYEVEFLLQQQWYDPRLRYSNRSQYEYLNAIHHYDDIWLPDTYFIMHGDFKDPLIPVHFALRIYRNGTVNYLMRRHLILSCQGRLNIFPFDDPLCSFAIESISYEQSAITYVWKNDEGTLRKSPSLTSLNAYLIKNQTITCPIKVSWRAEGQIVVDYEDEFDEFGDAKCSLCQRRFEEQGNYSCLKVDLIFTRDRAFYFTTVFIPGIILVTSSFITFWLEWNAVPARVMIGVTTMLNFFTTSNGFRSTLPVVSNLTAMNVWDGVCMCFIYASLLEFVCVNYVGRKRPMHNVVYRPGENPVTQKREGGPPTGATTGPNEIVTCTNCGPNPCTHTTTNGCTAELRKKEPPHPIRVAKTIDVIARITFPVAYFMFLTFFFIHYKGTS
ncbi:glycine receptor subunit alpha-4 isoform X11 [Bombus vosnesenskii]|uniref:Glycine receptor subunit alpha-4 isoform X11 n=4 Tax=Bombus TaxID=28641 RepID=A0A6J3JSW6_9HYME|nr:glycine receptor subunit alpha-4 isoform X11 [Bombus impatiens]XP_020722401.1 glycine receptor subunit alpha-4 isoform X10 [Bombus terrestris]XP_033205794.1 glycine receptor subunit alpha-4 isoform X11 [Bombus vancouverensis nearcticus]XP_033308053.1 glycine receptor subunit alpha-4 isoform X11 [Bombus bifarius]XP_033343882.1 glycine receptor subunit alpha-4 isoform X11 [Bombus vosnesenskii]XP_043601712.1 glycine receptor subunit alpha-4 isoform X31 [Bombus pyrosoma]XP_050484428.1 glycine 